MNFLLFLTNYCIKKLKNYFCKKLFRMYWTLELAQYLSDAPWPANKDELIDYAIRTGPLEVVEKLQAIEDEDGEIYDSIQDIWPIFPTEKIIFGMRRNIKFVFQIIRTPFFIKFIIVINEFIKFFLKVFIPNKSKKDLKEAEPIIKLIHEKRQF